MLQIGEHGEATRSQAFTVRSDLILMRPVKAALKGWQTDWDDFIRLFYRLLPGFTHLLENRDHRSSMVRMIQGDLHEGSEAEVLDDMRSLIRSVEEADAHPWRSQLVDLPF